MWLNTVPALKLTAYEKARQYLIKHSKSNNDEDENDDVVDDNRGTITSKTKLDSNRNKTSGDFDGSVGGSRDNSTVNIGSSNLTSEGPMAFLALLVDYAHYNAPPQSKHHGEECNNISNNAVQDRSIAGDDDARYCPAYPDDDSKDDRLEGHKGVQTVDIDNADGRRDGGDAIADESDRFHAINRASSEAIIVDEDSTSVPVEESSLREERVMDTTSVIADGDNHDNIDVDHSEDDADGGVCSRSRSRNSTRKSNDDNCGSSSTNRSGYAIEALEAPAVVVDDSADTAVVILAQMSEEPVKRKRGRPRKIPPMPPPRNYHASSSSAVASAATHSAMAAITASTADVVAAVALHPRASSTAAVTSGSSRKRVMERHARDHTTELALDYYLTHMNKPAALLMHGSSASSNYSTARHMREIPAEARGREDRASDVDSLLSRDADHE